MPEVLDHRSRYPPHRVIFQSGEEAWEDIEPDSSLLSSQLDKTIFDWANWWIVNITNRQDVVVSEAFSLVGEPLTGRPIVYLDQNHWSALAGYITEPERIRARSEEMRPQPLN